MNVPVPPHDLQFYVEPPTEGTMHHIMAHHLTKDRLTVLNLVYKYIRSEGTEPEGVKKVKMLKELKRRQLHTYVHLLESEGINSKVTSFQRCEDLISHFFLLIAHCHSEELMMWFLTSEVTLFKLRFCALSDSGVSSFLQAYGLQFPTVPREELESCLPNLLETYKISEREKAQMDFYKVDFIDVPDLVSSRKVFLKEGYAFVLQRDLISIVSNIFKMRVYRQLLKAKEHYENKPDFNWLARYRNFDMCSQLGGGVTLNQLDELSRYFPLCMRQLHEDIRKVHHAKYGTRLQYGLFLKGIGLTLNQSIQFWKSEFTKKMTDTRFNKDYLYGINYSYGKLGQMKSYPCYSCEKIINSPIGPTDKHGCPFKHNSETVLRNQLCRDTLPIVDVEDIMKLVRAKQYKAACNKYFDSRFPSEESTVIQNPAQFFKLSRQFHSISDN